MRPGWKPLFVTPLITALWLALGSNLLAGTAPLDEARFDPPLEGVYLGVGETRSAKEILAFEMKGLPGVTLVGERTAGAVLPAGYRHLAGGAVVMLPGDPDGINRLTGGGTLEGKGVEPDVEVPRAGPYSAGADPIFEAGLRSLLDRLRDVPRRRRW
jgi:hypothetical protein